MRVRSLLHFVFPALACLCLGGAWTKVSAQLQVQSCTQNSRGIIAQLDATSYPSDLPLVNLSLEAEVKDQYGNLVQHISSGIDNSATIFRLCIDYEDLMSEDPGQFTAEIFLNDADHTTDYVQRVVLAVDTGFVTPGDQQKAWIRSRPDDSIFYAGSQPPYPMVAYFAKVDFYNSLTESLNSDSTPSDVISSNLHDMLEKSGDATASNAMPKASSGRGTRPHFILGHGPPIRRQDDASLPSLPQATHPAMPATAILFAILAWVVACLVADCQRLPRIPQGGQHGGGGAALQVGSCVLGSRGVIVQLEYGDYSPSDPTLINLSVEASIQDQNGNVVGHSSSGTSVVDGTLRLCIDYEDLLGEDVQELGAVIYLNDADHTDDSVQRYILSVSTASDPPEQQQRVWIQSRPDDSLNYIGSQAPYPLVAYVRVNFNDESSGFITSGSGPGDAIYSTLHDMLKIHLCTNDCLIA